MKPLHIGLIMQGSESWMGGVEYIRNIALALARLPEEVRASFTLSLICSQALNADLYRQMVPHLARVYYEELERQKPTFLNRLRWGFREVILHKENYPLDPFLEKAHFDYVYPYFSPGAKPFRSAAWIYDFQHKHLPDYFPKEEISDRDRYFTLIARHAQTVILSSKTAKTDFDKFFPEASSKARILSFRVVPDPSWYEEDSGKTRQKYALPERFFLVSNQFWRHKNHPVIFEALKRLKEESIRPVVVCTGHLYDFRQPGYSDMILQTIHKCDLSRQVFLLGMIPKGDQIQLLRRSLAVIQPSLFEGWSTVVEEARCLGIPIILSDIPVHREQDPPRGSYFEPNSAEALASHLASGWEQLSPGPHLEYESAAKQASLKEVETFGSRFLKMAEGG
jgi:glycosyltransferase involved in cell wall biosynthesis